MTWDRVKYPIRASKVDGFRTTSYCVYTIWLRNCSSSLWFMIWDGVKYPIRACKVDVFRTKSYFVYTIWLSAEAIDLGRPYWILHPVSCHTPEAATTVFKYSWGWRQKASETCRVILQWLINILPSCITLVLYIYYIPLISRAAQVQEE